MFLHQNMRLEWPRISRSRIFGHGMVDLILDEFLKYSLLEILSKFPRKYKLQRSLKILMNYVSKKAAMWTSLMTFWHNVVKNLFMKYLKCHVNAQSVKVLIDFIASMFLIWHTFIGPLIPANHLPSVCTKDYLANLEELDPSTICIVSVAVHLGVPSPIFNNSRAPPTPALVDFTDNFTP